MSQYRWYKNGRMIVKSNDIDRDYISGITQEYFDEYIGVHKRHKRGLFLRQSKITSLGMLESVGGRLHLSDTNNLGTLGKLEHVDHDLLIENSKIESLGNLTHVRGNVKAYASGVKSLGNLRHVGLHLNLNKCLGLVSLGDLEHVGQNLNLSDTNITSLGNLKHVGEHISLKNTNITDLGKLEHVGGLISCDKTSPIYDILMGSKFNHKVRTY